MNLTIKHSADLVYNNVQSIHTVILDDSYEFKPMFGENESFKEIFYFFLFSLE